jgi:monofunctional biosynthetic peptidoglycan transglycosylase
MAKGSKKKKRNFLQKCWRWAGKIFLWLFIAQFAYIILLKWFYPPITVTQFVSWVSGHGLKRDYVGRKAISPNTRLAVISSEDQLFTQHHGFYWDKIFKALNGKEKNKGRQRGYSSISQQVAKNVFLWQGRSWIRKGLEVYFTFMIEKIWGKKRILDVYLNVIEMGDGIFGIEAASEKYFNKKAKDLTRPESAMIAACLPNPRRLRVKPQSAYMARRTQAILQQMSFLYPDPEVQWVIGMKAQGTGHK